MSAQEAAEFLASKIPEGTTTEPREPDYKVPFSGLNRKQRRRMAKRAKIFKDRSRDAWRSANKSIKNGGKKAHDHSH